MNIEMTILPTEVESQAAELPEKAQEQQSPGEQAEPVESVEDEKSGGVESESEDSTDEELPDEEKPQADKVINEEQAFAAEQPEATVEAESDTGRADIASSDNIEGEPAFVIEAGDNEEIAVSESTKSTTEPQAAIGDETASVLWTVYARDIMQRKVVWASGDDSVQQALTKMNEAATNYLIVGTEGAIEGIVSRNNLTGALSPYIRPVFARWRRPMDNATLQIRIKWIMNSLVHIVTPETALPAIMKDMCQFNEHCLPVVDKHGKVQGMITEFDIFSVLLRTPFG